MDERDDIYELETEKSRIERMKKAMGATAAAMLDADDERFLRWLAGWDRQTVEAAAKLFNSIEYCGAHPETRKDDVVII